MEVQPFPWPEIPDTDVDVPDYHFEFHIPVIPPTEWDRHATPFRGRSFHDPEKLPELYGAIVRCGLVSFLQNGNGFWNIVGVETYLHIDAPWHVGVIGDYISYLDDPWVVEGEKGPFDVLTPILRPWHVVVKQPDNPIEAHWRRYPFQDAKIAIVNVEQTDNPKHHKIIPKLIAILTTTVKHRGRPVGSVQPSPEEFEQMKMKAIAFQNLGYSWEFIAEKLGIEDTKTLRKYRKKWGIK